MLGKLDVEIREFLKLARIDRDDGGTVRERPRRDQGAVDEQRMILREIEIAGRTPSEIAERDIRTGLTPSVQDFSGSFLKKV
jgi:hypothetical protein